MNLRSTIVAKRLERIQVEGSELGHQVPVERRVPLVPFPSPPGIICEVKRRSPSRGDIDEEVDVGRHIGRYVEGGARSVSVLTEEDYFSGALSDLIEAKQANPQVSFLRKDFLLNREDVDVSYRAGADAILLIASILDSDVLADLDDYARSLGMSAMVEIHDLDDLQKAKRFTPLCVGCNARNLATFAVDLLEPLVLRRTIDWQCTTVFESGIWSAEDAAVAGAAGFDAMLVGESVVRDPGIVPDLIAGFSPGERRFWGEVANRIASKKKKRRPLIKICGLTRLEDVRLAVSLGADLIGFIFAPESPRLTTREFVRSVGRTEALKIAVVVSDRGEVPKEVSELLESGEIDAVQFHGDEEPDDCYDLAFPYYKACRVSAVDDLESVRRFRSPRVLIDAYSKRARGGTGQRIGDEIVRSAAETGPFWLAGGINDQNVAEIVGRFRPELIDVSSGIEKAPGVKEHRKLEALFDNSIVVT